jgi:hypothetical protein
MGTLFTRIKAAVADGRYVVSVHAAEQLRERGIPEWQTVLGLETGRLLSERPDDTPNPSIEVQQWLPDGTPIMAIWAWLSQSRLARLVTVHYFNR